MMTVERNVGRLLEISWAPPLSMAEMKAFVTKTVALVGSAPERLVICADLHRTALLPPDGVEMTMQMLRADNAGFDRSAILIPADGATVGMQAARLLREAGNPNRQAFTDAAKLITWLEPALEPAEIKRTVEFLKECGVGIEPVRQTG